MGCGVCKPSISPQSSNTTVKCQSPRHTVCLDPEGPLRDSCGSSGLGRSLETVTGTPRNDVKGSKRHSCEDATDSDVDSWLGSEIFESPPVKPKRDMSTGHGVLAVNLSEGDGMPSAEEVCAVLNNCLQESSMGRLKRVISVSSNNSKYVMNGHADDVYDADLEFLLSKGDRVDVTRDAIGGARHHQSKDSVYHSASHVDDLSYSSMSSIFSSPSVASWSDSVDSLIQEDRSSSVNSLTRDLQGNKVTTSLQTSNSRERPIRPNAARRRTLEVRTLRTVYAGLPAAVS